MRAVPAELRGFLAAFDPAIGRLFLATRATVLAAAPQAHELIYDAYNAVSAAYTFSGRLSEASCHVAAYSGHVNLGFNHGAELRDPTSILIGSGARIRHVGVAAAADLRAPAWSRSWRRGRRRASAPPRGRSDDPGGEPVAVAGAPLGPQ